MPKLMQHACATIQDIDCIGIVCMKTMNAAHRPRTAWTLRSMFNNDDDINYLTASIVLSFNLSSIIKVTEGDGMSLFKM